MFTLYAFPANSGMQQCEPECMYGTAKCHTRSDVLYANFKSAWACTVVPEVQGQNVHEHTVQTCSNTPDTEFE